jgi:hypothetical protein
MNSANGKHGPKIQRVEKTCQRKDAKGKRKNKERPILDMGTERTPLVPLILEDSPRFERQNFEWEPSSSAWCADHPGATEKDGKTLLPLPEATLRRCE